MFQPHFSTRLLVLAISTLSTATIATTSQATDVITLPDTVVTASRIETPLRDVIGDVTVIDAEELKTHAGQTLAEVLQAQSGVQWKQNGSLGTVSGISLRGASAQSTLVIIDGIRYGSATVGQAALENIPADQISRIEVLYGSSATSLYGADAIGGVIQIFTKTATEKKNNINATIGVGTEGTRLYSGGFNTGNQQTRFGMTASHRTTDGISATNPAVSFGYESDDDGNTNDSVSAGLSHRFSKKASVGLNGLMTKSLVDYDGGNPNGGSRNTNNVSNVNLWGKYNLADAVDVALQYGVNTDENKGVFSRFETTQRQGKVQLDYALPDSLIGGKVIAGIENLEQEVASSTAFTQTERDTRSVLLGYQFAEKYLQGQFNVRQDDISGYSRENSYSAGLAVEPIEGVRFGASYATGFRAPTFNDLYYPYQNFFGYEYQGNPDLVPEESKNTEAFFAVDLDQIRSRVSLFHNDVDNLIGSGVLSNGVNSVINVNQAKLEGVSWKTDWEKDNLMAGAHYDFLKATDEKTGKRLRNRAKHAGGLYAGINVQEKLTLRGELDYVGLRFDDAANTKRLDGYTLFNLASTVKFSPNIDGSLRWNNVFGTDYETVSGYNTLGPNALASITIHNK